MFEEPALVYFILFLYSFFFAFRDLERAEILSRHSNREELKLLPRRNRGLERAYIARITKKILKCLPVISKHIIQGQFYVYI